MKASHFSFRRLLAPLLVCGAVGAGILLRPAVQGDQKPYTDPALERTRKQVRMLDDLYKNAIVLITTHYVEEDSDLAAGDAFQALFKVMKDKGWHEVRLLDATGEPYDDDNTPKDDFEKQAIQRLKAGEAYIDVETTTGGRRQLRAATPIPVVMKKCVMCHAHYADVPASQPIGALAYRMEIE